MAHRGSSPFETIGPRYLQYLDDFAFKTVNSHLGLGEEDLTRRVEKIIKLHALWGGRIVFTSITPIGSTVIMSLFSNPTFRRFVKQNPDFFELVNNFEIAGKRDQKSMALSGLRRAIQPGWKSSLLENSEPLVELAGALLEEETINPEKS